jgi:hypothetical protein
MPHLLTFIKKLLILFKIEIMKKLLLLIGLMYVSTLGIAQKGMSDSAKVVKHGAGKHGDKMKQVPNPASWACPKCYAITKDGGVCAADQSEKVQLGTYYCAHCMKASGSKPGKCASCSMATTQMTRKLCAKNTVKMPVKKAA